MAATAPPKEKPQRKAPPPEKERHWSEQLFHSSFFLGAVFLHLVIFLMVATWIIFPRYVPPSDDFSKTYVPSSPPPPPPATTTPTMPVPTHNIAPPTTVITSNTSAPVFNIPLPDLNPTTEMSKTNPKMTAPATKNISNLASRLGSIKSTVKGWGRDDTNLRNANGDTHNVVAKFPVFIAQYANGDWNCNIEMTGINITGGSLPNLVEKINQWSHGNIRGGVIPTPLQIGGHDLLDKKPPFVFFTGHKDFVLTNQEIENLRNYLQDGGCIWGDNALAGEGSRFDVAFRREMKRVIPDADKNFEPVALTDDIYTKSYFPISKVPPGMNFYDEPLLHIDLDGKLAVLYTPNDYSDLFCVHILPGDQQPDLIFPYTGPLHTNMTMWWKRDIFFRNFTLESAIAADQLGMNIISYLLVRFDRELLLTP